MNKICTQCGLEQPETNFSKACNTRDGLRHACKDCIKQYRFEHMEKIRERRKQYNDTHGEQISAHRKQYYEEHKKEVSHYTKAYYNAHREQSIENMKQYYSEHKEESSAYYKQYNAEHKEEHREYRKQRKEVRHLHNKVWRDNNKDATKKTYAIWAKNHPDAIKRICQTRRAKKVGLARTLTTAQWQHILDGFNNTCAYCGAGDKKLQQEHFIPLSTGGEYTHNNIIPACRSCNSSKGKKDFFIWYPTSICYDKQREKKVMKFLHYTGTAQQLTLC